MNRNSLLGVVFALLAAVGFSAKAILVKLAFIEGVDAVTLLALRLVRLAWQSRQVGCHLHLWIMGCVFL